VVKAAGAIIRAANANGRDVAAAATWLHTPLTDHATVSRRLDQAVPNQIAKFRVRDGFFRKCLDKLAVSFGFRNSAKRPYRASGHRATMIRPTIRGGRRSTERLSTNICLASRKPTTPW
jgi:hypothetical protein